MKQGKDKFKLPSYYFENLSKKVLQKIHGDKIYEELYGISTFVAQYLKKKNLFKIPKGYFETLSQRTKQQIDYPYIKVYSLKRELVFALSAASVIVIFSFFIFSFSAQKTANTFNQMTHVEDKTIFTALTLEQDETSLETEVAKDKEIVMAVSQSIEAQNDIAKNLLEQETDLDKNLENELEKVLENELDNL
jgi:hypothetical protein